MPLPILLMDGWGGDDDVGDDDEYGGGAADADDAECDETADDDGCIC